ncbi:ATPase, T2SS/T4P/T4SS family [Thermococcus sp. GR6]|uniref:ATPase, T2SS/T4P/T4SS family n=1 Tax=Thermococcus sp. GR6 TaxID=1638256 RepID=UPI001430A786|nr:ATPase, T2SS/T4P/T4SS family [Thermococcus sp. GR6]NJE42727.1 ATPase [Thermococcus sp. GR6]
MGVYIFTPEDLLRYGTITEEQLEILKDALLERKDILIVGSSRSGKTKLVEALIHLIPDDRKVAVITAYSEFKPFKPNIVVIDTQFNPESLEKRTEDVIEKIKRINPDYIVIDTIHTVHVPTILSELLDDYTFIATSLAISGDIIEEVKHWLRANNDVMSKFDIVVELKRDFRTGTRKINRIYAVKKSGEKVELEPLL